MTPAVAPSRVSPCVSKRTLSLIPVADRPSRDAYPINRHAFTLINPTTLDGKSFPYGGPRGEFEDAKNKRRIASCRSSIPLQPQDNPNTDEALKAHFISFMEKMFYLPEQMKTVALDAVYLVIKDYQDGKDAFLNLSALTQREISAVLRNCPSKKATLHTFAGIYIPEDPQVVHEKFSCTIGQKSGGSTFVWEQFLTLDGESKNIARQRIDKKLGLSSEFLTPEERLARKFSNLDIPSPRNAIKAFTDIPENQAAVCLFADSVKKTPDPKWIAKLKLSAEARLDALKERYFRLKDDPEGRLELCITGDMVEPTSVDPNYGNELCAPWDEPYRSRWIDAFIQDAVLLSTVLGNPQMLLAHKFRADNPIDLPVRTKHIAALQAMADRHEAATYSEFGLEPTGHIAGNDGVVESTTKGLLNLWDTPYANMTAMPVMGSSMNWMAGALLYAKQLLSGMNTWISCDGTIDTPEAQLMMYKRVLELIDSDPAVTNYPFPEAIVGEEKAKDYWIRTAKERLGVTLKITDVASCVETIKLFLSQDPPLKNFRLYDAGATSSMVSVTKELVSIFGNRINLIPGQVANTAEAKELAELGVAGVICGVGDGGHCTTAQLLGMFANNVKAVYEIVRRGFGIHVIPDGGLGSEGVANGKALGGSAVMVSGATARGTFEHPGLLWYLKEGALFKGTRGEASVVTKAQGLLGKVFQTLKSATSFVKRSLGIGYDRYPFFANVEGVEGEGKLNPLAPTVTFKVLGILYSLSKAARFNRYRTLAEATIDPEPPIVRGSTSADYARNPHVTQPRSRTLVQPKSAFDCLVEMLNI